MTTTSVITYSCDIPGDCSEAVHEAVTFSLDGQHYEADLCDGHRMTLELGLEPFIAAARPRRRDTPGTRRAEKFRSTAHRKQMAEIRQWAIASRLMSPEDTRGRIPASVLARYEAEHGGQR